MQPGVVLGQRFEIIGELGKGSMATVYLVEDRIRGTRVALKVLHEHLADDPDARARLVREVRAASRIQHPNALVAQDIHDLDGRLALSMPVHRGLTLAGQIDAHGPMDESALERLAKDLTGALAAAHNVGVIHRDVSPNNIFVEREGAAVLADFGLARIEGHGTKTAAAGPGTWGYAAPEVYSGSRGDPRSDVYSLGASLYFAATGKSPFAADNPGSILKRQLEGSFTSLAELRPHLSEALVSSIEGMLVLEPDQRTQGAREAMDALECGEAPRLPTRVTPSSELAVGMYTVIVKRVAAFRRGSGPISREDATEAERQLAIAVRGSMPDALPASMRRFEFKLVEGVDRETAERLSLEAVRLGFAPRVINDPHVRWSKGFTNLYAGTTLLASTAVISFLLAFQASAAFALFLVFFSAMSAVAAAGLFGWTTDRRTLQLAFHRALPQEHSALPQVGQTTPLLRMHARTDAKLAALENALHAQLGLPTALVDRISATLLALRKRAFDLAEPHPWERLLESDEDGASAVSRIHQRLQRLDTLARAGESVDEQERQNLLDGLEAFRQSERFREDTEALRTRVAARLLEIGAAATRATRILKRDGDRAESVQTLLAQLVVESEAAAEVVAEMEQLEGPSGARVAARKRERN